MPAATFGTDITKAISILEQHKILGIQTDTIFGLAADSRSDKAISEIYHLKKRDFKKPLPCLFHSIVQIKEYAIISDFAEKILHFSSTPITVVVPLKHEAKINTKFCYNKNNRCTIAVRVSNHILVKQLLRQLNRPLFVTSSNISTQPEIVTLQDMCHKWANSLEYILADDRISCSGIASIIIDTTTKIPLILRHNKYSHELQKYLDNC